MDAARPDADTGRAGGLLFAAPEAVLTAWDASEVGRLLGALDAAIARGRHVAGFLAYESGYALEPSVFAPPDEALLGWFGVYGAPEPLSAHAIEAVLAEAGPVGIDAPEWAWPPEAYAEKVAAVRGHIRAGDVYQINLTAPFRFSYAGDPLGLYSVLRARQPVPYGAYIDTGERQVLSFSPELFFRHGDARITARPMKGTAPRGIDPAVDDQIAEALAADPKNRAENLMIVDLLRNDLGRIAAPGSVEVPHLFATERYRTVTQMTSTVRATLRSDVSLAEIFRALFPCGSVTGAPKLRAMQRIRELEDGPRGVYCGAIGYAGPGEAVFSVPIRTVELVEGTGQFGVGSGVVWDSEAEAEYQECLLKARFLTDAL